MNPGEKFYQWITGNLDFASDKNFNETALAFSRTKEFNDQREIWNVP